VPAQPWKDDGVRLAIEQRVDILEVDAAACQRGPVGRFGHVRFGAEQMRRLDYGLLKGQILERVQSVVMDENTDWPLYRKQVRRVFNGLAQFIPAQLIGMVALPQTNTARHFLVRVRAWLDIDSCRDELVSVVLLASDGRKPAAGTGW
jgi:hypothetical protein